MRTKKSNQKESVMKNKGTKTQGSLFACEASAAFAQDSQLKPESFSSGFKEGNKMSSPILRGKSRSYGFHRVFAAAICWLLALTAVAAAADGQRSTVVIAGLVPQQVLD